MKVICINKDTPARNHPDLIKAVKKIVVGEIYNVVVDESRGYELAEFPHPLQILWSKENFIPLSNIDETELITERQLTVA